MEPISPSDAVAVADMLLKLMNAGIIKEEEVRTAVTKLAYFSDLIEKEAED